MNARRIITPKSLPGPLEVTLLFTGFIAATYGFGIYLFSALLTDMRRDLGLSYSAVGYVTGGVQAGFLVFALLSGLLAPRFGMKRTVITSVLMTSVCLLLMPLVKTTALLAVLLTLMGASAASVWVPMVSVAKSLVSEVHLGKALGLMSSGTAYGIFLNGLVMPVMLPAYGWRSVWLLVGLMTMTLAAWSAWRIGFSDARADKSSPEAHIPQKLSRAVFKRPATVAVLAMMLLNGLSCMPVQNYLSAMMREQLGYDVNQVAQIVSINGAVGMVSGLLIGALADRISIKWAMVVTYVILSIAATCFWWHTSLTTLYVGAVCFGLAFYALFGLVPAYVGVMFTSAQATTIFGIGNVLLGIGGMVGNFFGGITKQSTGNFDSVFLLVLASSFGTLLLSLFMGKEHKTDTAPTRPDDLGVITP
jgi:predicted MFS family arabinose efflux permease